MKESYIAKVIDNDSSDKDGKVQIYIPHLMEGFNTSHYPWVRQSREFTSFIPEVGEYVWAWFEDEQFLKKGYYGNKVTLKEYHDHNETIGSMTGSYPDIKYIKLANGVTFALNSNEKEASLKVGDTEIYIADSGEVTIETKGQKINITDGVNTFNLLTHKHTTGIGPTGTIVTGS